jgi:hypothetical protein
MTDTPRPTGPGGTCPEKAGIIDGADEHQRARFGRGGT